MCESLTNERRTRRRIKRETLSNLVYVKLRGLLAAGELTPGERLSLRKVAETLGVSVMPVREGATRLIADDALEVMPNRGSGCRR